MFDNVQSSMVILFGLVLFSTIALIFNFRDDRHLFPTINLQSENKSIEDALERMPTCTPYDRERQRALLSHLQAWNQFAQEHQIRYWIAYGSLVGYTQRRGLLPHDPDTDVLMMSQDTAQLYELSRLHSSTAYELVVHPQWFIVGEAKRSYFRDEGVHFVAPNARFINKKSRRHVDIWPIYDYHPNQKRMQKNMTATLTEYDNGYNWISSPKEWTFPLKRCKFSGVNVWCPSQPEKLVANIYGAMSVNTSSIACINGSWVKSNKFKF